MLQNEYLLAKVGADTAENEQHVAEILPTDALWRRRHDARKGRDRGCRVAAAAVRTAAGGSTRAGATLPLVPRSHHLNPLDKKVA